MAFLLPMTDSGPREAQVEINSRLIDSLYTEAMLLADEARSYFDDCGRDERVGLEPFARVGFACESLRITTRIMHIVAWLLTQRAIDSGEIPPVEGRRPERKLGNAQDSDPAVVTQLPERAQRLIGASTELYARVKRIDEGQGLAVPAPSPARALMGRLERDLRWTERRRAHKQGAMQDFSFHYGPRLIVGGFAHEQLPALLGDGPCLFVTDGTILKLGLARPYLDAVSAGREVAVFSEVEADPSLETLLAAVETGRSIGAAAVVGFGGGSPMDVAKLAAYLLGSGDALEDIWGVERATGKRLPLVLVPTTAGTGSEVSPIAVITVEGGTKLAVNSRALAADAAILDAELTIGLPRHVTAATGIDAIVHSLEAYTSARLKNPLSDLFAIKALKLLCGNLETACEDPGNRAARSAMLLGANLAGVAFSNAPVAGVHALAYPLGGLHHLPHGLANALMLRPVLEHNSEAARELYAELAPIVDPGCAGAGTQGKVRALINGLERLCLSTGLQLRLRDHGIPEDDAGRLAGEAMKQERLLVNNPCAISEADARRLYEAAW